MVTGVPLHWVFTSAIEKLDDLDNSESSLTEIES